MAREAVSTDLKVDIRVDGVSILTSEYATLNKGGAVEEHAEDYANEHPHIGEGSVVSFHVIKTGGSDDFTCQLEMTSLNTDDEDESE